MQDDSTIKETPLIHAGFPSPAQDYMGGGIDLNKELVHHPEATFFARVTGDSMVEADVNEGDVLVIDKSLHAGEGDMAVCFVDGEFTLKFISFNNKKNGRTRKDNIKDAEDYFFKQPRSI